MSDETTKNTEGTNPGTEPDYSEHFALAAKGKGCSGKLYGNVTLVAFLVHDRSSAWKDGDIDKIKSVLEKPRSSSRKKAD
ncbi:MAG: hypothetical protein IKI64_06775 [Clostridia bacterium]|nr:hypothetical protein [Clostridia bacterium]